VSADWRMAHARPFILSGQLAKEGPGSAAGEDNPRRAHKRSRSAGPRPVDRRRQRLVLLEAAGDAVVSDRKRVGVVHEHDVLRHGRTGALPSEVSERKGSERLGSCPNRRAEEAEGLLREP
jgi:hypothetical protein